ncbi:MAG TPA: type II secretion system F family protein [Candidatus Dormibacteraeota bacterium]|nr:type II secretion system F family protein [Candidatus Dormibacteraeota bacterium]
MPDPVIPLVLLILGGGLVAGMWRMGVFTPRAVVAWTRIGRHHHLTDERPLDERLGDRVPSLSRFFRETSVPRLLAIANRRESLNTWALKVTVYVLIVGAALMLVDLFASVSSHSLPVPPLVCLLVAGCFAPLSYLSLRSEARRRQDTINRSIAQALSEMAILTSSGAYTVSGSLEFVARCQRDRSLLNLLSDDNWRRLAEADDTQLALSLRPNQLLSTVTIYQRIGRAYDVQMFDELATNMRRIAEKGLVASDVLTSLSEATGKKLAADMTVKTEQARPRMALAIGLMVLPLLSLILYPAAVAIGNAFK